MASASIPHARHRRDRAAIGLAAAISGTGIPAHAASPVNYVALGDSYSSGVGAGSDKRILRGRAQRLPGPLGKANALGRVYVRRVLGRYDKRVISSQLSSLSASTTLVSITIGGNDAGFCLDYGNLRP